MKIRSIRFLTVEGLKNVWVNRLMSLASVGVLMACMLLMGVAIALSLNVDQSLGDLQQQNVVMVYFADGRAEVDNFVSVEEMRAMPNIFSADYISKEEGLEDQIIKLGEEFREFMNWQGDEIPLPDGAMVKFNELALYDETFEALKAMPGVQSVNGSPDLAATITAIARTIAMAGFWIIALLMIIALVIIANTIRITMHSRRLEISIMKAVGATSAFIRFPFIIEGMTLGIASGGLTTLLLYGVYRLAADQIQQSFDGFVAVPFRSFYLWMCGLFMLIGLLAGVIGSMLIMGKYLKREGSAFGALQ